MTSWLLTFLLSFFWPIRLWWRAVKLLFGKNWVRSRFILGPWWPAYALCGCLTCDPPAALAVICDVKFYMLMLLVPAPFAL